MRITIASWLTISRLLLIVPILGLLAAGAPLLALVLLAFALLTDFLDGEIARRTGTITRLGTFLDHFADKVLVHVILLYFVAVHGLSWIAFGIFLVRDFLVLGFRHLATQRGVEVPSMSLGKVKFAGQSILLLLLVAGAVWEMGAVAILTHAVLWITVALAIVSAAQIIHKGWPALR